MLDSSLKIVLNLVEIAVKRIPDKEKKRKEKARERLTNFLLELEEKHKEPYDFCDKPDNASSFVKSKMFTDNEPFLEENVSLPVSEYDGVMILAPTVLEKKVEVVVLTPPEVVDNMEGVIFFRGLA